MRLQGFVRFALVGTGMALAVLVGLAVSPAVGAGHGKSPTINPSDNTVAEPVYSGYFAQNPPTNVSCGGQKPLKSNGNPWTCTFDDEFNNSSVDWNRWMPQTTANSGFATGDTCYRNNAANIGEGNGGLILNAHTLAKPMTCSYKSYSYQTNHTGGAIVSYNSFAQTYGRFEFRAKFPGTTEPGFWGNLWIYPKATTYGAWPNSGEVDIAEHWSGHGDHVYPSLHYKNSTSADTAWNCTVNDPSQFHTYRLEWNKSSMSFYYDNQLCFTRNWTTSFLSDPNAPFDKPFFIVLSEGFGDPYFSVAGGLPTDGPMVVDWVHVYK